MRNLLAHHKWLVGIILVSVVLRVSASLYIGDFVVDLPGTFDQISYHQLALRVLGGYGFSFSETWWPITAAGAPTAHWSFLYTFYLTAVYYIFGPHPIAARLVQSVIVGILQPFLAYRVGTSIFSKPAGLVGASITAIYAYFIYYDATLMTEPFYITCVLAGIYLSIKATEPSAINSQRRTTKDKLLLSILLGFVLGCAVLLRQLFLLLVPFLFAWIWWARRKNGEKSTLPLLLIITAIIITMIVPFSVYNASRFGRFVMLNTNSGFAFYWANHPIYGTHFQPILTNISYQDLIPAELRSLNEAELDQALLQRGMQFVINDPIRYVLLSFSRIPAYFMFWPSNDSGTISNISRVASFGLFLPFMLYGLVKSLVDQKKKFLDNLASPTYLLVLFVFLYTCIHILSWALIRYRLPVDAVLIVFASLPLVSLMQRIKVKNQV